MPTCAFKGFFMDFTELGRKPIPGAVPAGQDVRNDPDFEILTAEIEKLSSPTFSGSIDWKKIIVVAGRILEEKSKDLLVMAYLCAALQKSEGLRGLAKGIHILREAVETFWEDMFPIKKRMRGRKNAIEWLTDRLRDDLNAFDRFLTENMEDAPILISIINEISTRVSVEKKIAASKGTPCGKVSPIKQPPPPEAAQVSSSVTAALSTQPPAVIPEFDLTNTDAEKMLNQALDVLGRAATLLGSQDPPNPLAFRMNRIAAWTSITELPPTTGGKTYLPGPDSQVVSALQDLYQSHNWKDLVQAAEARVRQFLFWLDLSRYVAESLEQLGYPEGADMVATETLLYIKRLPGIEKLSFEDGTAFANEITRSWLKSLQDKQVGTAAGNVLPGTESIQQAVEGALAAARKLIRDNRITEALRQFNDGTNRSSSMKERFLWQHGLCRLLFEIQQPRLALPQIQDMLAAIDTYRIEQWEPNLATEALTIILTGLRLQPEKDQEQLGPVFNRLAKLDPVKAMDFI
jgi:type VI secretion system protein VasJ